MAELPGWDRDRLATADPRDVAAARHLIFARVLAPVIRRNFPGEIRELELKMPGRRHSEAEVRSELKRSIEELRAGERRQATFRELLGLDEPDDDDPGDDDGSARNGMPV